jgi:triacylglycerol lipase
MEKSALVLALLAVSCFDAGVAAEAGGSSRSAEISDYTETLYPFVLAHGMSGFDSVFGQIDYWYGIPGALRDGGATVFITEVSQFDDSEKRGEQLLAQVEEIVAVTGEGKAHLIGHSQGGHDIRYVAAVRPDLVASVTSIGSPHDGSAVADWLRENIEEGSFTELAASTMAEMLGDLVALLSGTSNPQDAIAALELLSTEGSRAFAAKYSNGMPTTSCGEGAEEVDGVRYYSWGGTGIVTTGIDISDAMLALTGTAFNGGENDGLVGRCSTHLGRVIRDDYRQNHLDLSNQLLGLTSWLETSPVTLFRAHANRLKNLGL